MHDVFNPTAETGKENNEVNARFGGILIGFIAKLQTVKRFW